jgi:hypothetical protein
MRCGLKIIAVCALAVLSAGCAPKQGAGAPAPTPSAGPSQVLDLYKQLARCVRAHGVPGFPDPVVNPQTGKVDFGPGTPKPSASVLNACKSITDRLPPSEKNGSVTAAELVKLRQLARCMRDNGLRDWPDPDAQGDFPLPKRLVDLGKKGIRTQLDACRPYFPSHGISIKQPAGSNG